MVNAHKVSVVWTGLEGSPYLTTLWVNAALFPTPANVQTFTSGICALLCEAVSNELTANLQTEVSTWSTPDTLVDTFAITGGAVPGVDNTGNAPRATQGLLRLRTNAFNGNRRILGHIYVPGVPAGAIDLLNGKPTSAYLTELNAAAAAMDAGALVVAARKSNQFVETTTVTADSEFAVLRSRRD